MGARITAILKHASVAKLVGNVVLVVAVATAIIYQAPSVCQRN